LQKIAKSCSIYIIGFFKETTLTRQHVSAPCCHAVKRCQTSYT